MIDPAMLRAVEERLREVEARTGVQVVVAALERADVYHGLRWRAFAFGAALAGALVVLGGALRPGWFSPLPPLFAAVAGVLGAGLCCALAATFLPAVERLFLEPLRAEAEVQQRAAVLFLERELFATRARTAVLLLACGFERLAAVRADSGFGGRVSDGEWRAVSDAVTARLRAGRVGEGLLDGLESLERLLRDKGFAQAGGGANELPDGLLKGTGAR